MVNDSFKFSKATKINFVGIAFFIFLGTRFVYGVPINFSNNKNNYNENHINRPLPNQPPGPPQRPPSLYKQPSQSQGPEMEDFGRPHKNQNQFKRHAKMPPEMKMTPGVYQQNPPEQFVKPSGGSSGSGTHFRQNVYDESYQQPNSDYHNSWSPPLPQMQTEEAQDFHQRSHGQNIPHNRRHSRDSSPPPPSPSNHFNNNPYREEAHAYFDHIPNQYHQQRPNDNEVFRERNAYSQDARPDEQTNTFKYAQAQHRGKPPVGQQWQEQHPPQPNKVPNAFMEFPGHGKPSNNIPVPSTIPQPTAVAIVVPGATGNSTLFIEYDVSDNDVTYETIVEVEDVPEGLVNSNHVRL